MSPTPTFDFSQIAEQSGERRVARDGGAVAVALREILLLNRITQFIGMVCVVLFLSEPLIWADGPAGEVLYNGIRLPAQWPPRDPIKDLSPRPIPYLAQPPHVIPIKTKARVDWKSADDLFALSGRKVRFRFLLRQGALYSFWVTPDANGASYGYVASGGPDFPGPLDTVGQ